jgi:hypothetical protein
MDIDLKQYDDDALIDLAGRAFRELWDRDLGRRAWGCLADAQAEVELHRREVAELARKKVEEEARRKRDEERALALKKEQEANEWIRSKIVEAREVIGHGTGEFGVKVWQERDHRVYVGSGFRDDWVVYYHTGTAKHDPGTVEVERPVLLGIKGKPKEVVDAYKAKVAAYCASLCERYSSLRFDVPE